MTRQELLTVQALCRAIADAKLIGDDLREIGKRDGDGIIGVTIGLSANGFGKLPPEGQEAWSRLLRESDTAD